MAALRKGSKPKSRKPRAITRAVRVMRQAANDLERYDGIAAGVAVVLRREAGVLDQSDARETRLDPSKRRKAKKQSSARAR